MDHRRAIIGAFIVMTAGNGAALADVIELKDGRILSGTSIRHGDIAEIRVDGGASISVKPDDIIRTTLTSTTTPEEAATAEWTRDTALIKQASDLPTIIDLHQKFLQRFPDQQLSPIVSGSLEVYQRLQNQNGVKFRGRWMPAAQVDVTLRQWQSAAAPAAALYKAGKLRPALDAAKQLIAHDAANPQALTLAGLTAYRLDDLRASIDYFTALAEADPSDALAQNNLAVVLFSEKREVESLSHYTQALQAAPSNRLLADNIMEALHAYRGSTDAPLYQKLVRQFQQAETRLESDMAKRGLFRYGSTWVTQPQLDRLNATIQAITSAMAELQSQYQSAQQDSIAIADQLKTATDDYNNTVVSVQYLNSTMLQSGGDVGLSSRRDALLADLERSRQLKASLEAKRDALVTGRPEMFAQAAKLKTQLADATKSQFTGVQRIMDLGEAENPPPPTVVPLPPPVLVTPQIIVHQDAPPNLAPPGDSNLAYQQIYNVGSNAVVPIFVIPPQQRRDHQRHDNEKNAPPPLSPIFPQIIVPRPTGPTPFSGSTAPTNKHDGTLSTGM